MEDNVELGGHIQLSGFKDIDSASMVIVKKMIGNYARKMSDNSSTFEKLHITMKPVHATEKSEKYEVHAHMIDSGKPYVSEVTDRNLFVAIDLVLKKIQKAIN